MVYMAYRLGSTSPPHLFPPLLEARIDPDAIAATVSRLEAGTAAEARQARIRL